MFRAFKSAASGALLAAIMIAGAAPASADVRYDNPHVNGAVVDWCAHWAADCGWGGANQYCRTRGHPNAVNWSVYRPGRTWVIGSNQYCTGEACQGFSQVTCGTGGSRRFDNPQMNGAVVDWCATWAANCGWGGAHQLCQRYGYAAAYSWNVYRPGRTWVIGNNQYCNGPACQGFSQVTCRR